MATTGNNTSEFLVSRAQQIEVPPLTHTQELSIRSLRTLQELDPIIQLQKAVWGFSDLDIIHPIQAYNVVKCGGQVLGAFSAEGIMIGFTYAIFARGKDGKQHHLHSDLVGVLPEYQSSGVGLQMKLKQRELALQEGIKQIVWTYDPMETLNANFNLRKLGGLACNLERNLYGTVENDLSGGLPTHRFLVEWNLTDIDSRKEFPESVVEASVEMISEGLPHLKITLPTNFQEIKDNNLAKAVELQKN